MKKKRSYPAVQFGTSLMLVIFVILCLTAFASLSLSSALRDYDYSKKAAQKTSQYYAADTAARHTAAEIGQLLKDAYEAGPDTYAARALESLGKMEGITVETETGSVPVISWQTPMNDRQALEVRLVLRDAGEFSVSAWKEVSTEPWDNETSLPVLGSDSSDNE